VGRLVPTKGYDRLVRAFGKIKTRLPATRLILVGGGRLYESLKAQAAAQHAGGSIMLLGPRDDVPELLAAFDAFVLPSIAEGSPRSLAEAMACGLLCIASRTGEIPFMLEDGRLGRLTQPGDEEALAEAMLSAAGIPGPERARLAAMSCEKAVRCYGHAAAVKRLEQVYENECRRAGRLCGEPICAASAS
jgi:glycosyltransferase involved in cell wall biosynthesis